MKHKHAEIIKAWADGAEIQYLCHLESEKRVWMDCVNAPNWYTDFEYRIKPEPKPEPKPDFCKTFFAHGNYDFKGIHLSSNLNENHNLALIFDGETGELKNAEVIK